jgi:hypothetical protein
VETFSAAATHAVAPPSSSVDLTAAAPAEDMRVTPWPAGARLAILIGGSAALWSAIAWVAYSLIKLS